MNRNFHLQFIGNAHYMNTAAEAAALEIEDLIVRKSHAICDDAVDWDFLIKNAQAKLAEILKR